MACIHVSLKLSTRGEKNWVLTRKKIVTSIHKISNQLQIIINPIDII